MVDAPTRWLSTSSSPWVLLVPARLVFGGDHVIVDGTVVETDRVRIPGPTSGVDLWWSAKVHNHGGNIQFKAGSAITPSMLIGCSDCSRCGRRCQVG